MSRQAALSAQFWLLQFEAVVAAAAAVGARVAALGDVRGEVAVAVEELVATVEQVDGVGAARVRCGGWQVVFGALDSGAGLAVAGSGVPRCWVWGRSFAEHVGRVCAGWRRRRCW